MRTFFVIALVMIVAGTLSAQTFNAPAEVVELTGSPASEYSATLTGDMLTVYWTSTRTGGVGGRDIWMATRPNLASPWGTPVNVTELNTTWEEYYISVRSDNLEFIISTNRKSQVAYQADLFVSTRPDVKSKWGTPVEITELNSTVVADTEDDPSLRADGLEIFFTSDRTGGLGAAIWHATRPDWKSVWSAPTVVAEIDTSSTEHSPAISGDGLTLLFASTRTGGTGSSDYYMVTRPDVNSKFGTAVELAEVNSTLWDHNGSQTVDGYAFYYTYNQANKIYRATRILPVIYPPSGNPVRGKVFSIYVRHDPGDVVGVVAGSLATLPGPVAIPGMKGGLELNLALGFWLMIGPMDKEGKYTNLIPVPNEASLKGVDLYFQGASQDQTKQISISQYVKVTIQ